VLHEVERVGRGNPNLTVEFHQHGGHVGFVTGRRPWAPQYYAEERVMHYFDTEFTSSSAITPG
jgi:predicted alpha/beta-fold hydrolase